MKRLVLLLCLASCGSENTCHWVCVRNPDPYTQQICTLASPTNPGECPPPDETNTDWIDIVH